MYPTEFNNVRLTRVHDGIISDPNDDITIQTIKHMWIYFRNNNGAARYFHNAPPTNFSINSIRSLYEKYEQIFLDLIFLDNGVLYFRSNVHVNNHLFIIKDGDKFSSISFDLTIPSEQLNDWLLTVNQLTYNRWRYQGHIVMYALFKIIPLMEDLNIIPSFEQLDIDYRT